MDALAGRPMPPPVAPTAPARGQAPFDATPAAVRPHRPPSAACTKPSVSPPTLDVATSCPVGRGRRLGLVTGLAGRRREGLVVKPRRP